MQDDAPTQLSYGTINECEGVAETLRSVHMQSKSA